MQKAYDEKDDAWPQVEAEANAKAEAETAELRTMEALWETIDWKTAGVDVYEEYGRSRLFDSFRKQPFPQFM